jgi:hypothetical protein
MTSMHSLFGSVAFLACIGWAWGEPAPYLRATDDKNGGRILQVASRTLVSPKEDGPRVTLLGVSHLGDATYYEKIQKKLDAADLVLFEGVGFGDEGPPKKEEGDSSAVSELQLSLARSMGLIFQMEAIRYDRPHFRNSDISPEALLIRLQGGPLKFPGKGKGDSGGKGGLAEKDGTTGKVEKGNFQSRELMKALSGNSFVFNFLGKALSFFGKDPKIRALMKLAIVEMLGAIEGDVTRLAKASGAGMEKFMRVLLEDRNAIVFRDLRKVIKGKNPPDSIVVFYGAAHMPDLENRLVKKLGFQPDGDEWFAAFGVDPKKAGLSAFEVELVRKMIRMQIQKITKQGN